MAATKPRPIQFHAALYVLTACIAVLGQGLWSELQGYVASVTRAEEVTNAVAIAVSRNANDTLRIAEQELSGATANGPAVKSTYQGERPGYGPVLAFDGGGDLLWANGLPGAPVPLTAPSEVAARYAAGETGQLVTPIDLSSEGLGTILAISRPLDDVPGGFVMALVLPAAFLDFFLTFADTSELTITLTDRTGKMRIGINQEQLSEGATDALRQQLFSEAEADDGNGAAPRHGLPGRVVGHSMAEHFPVAAVVTISEEQATSEWRAWLPMRLGLVATSLLILTLLGHRLSEQVRRRAAAEEEIQRREAEFRLLTESAADAVERFDHEGVRLYASPAASRLLGYSTAELVGRHVIDLVHEEDRPIVLAARSRLMDGSSTEETTAARMKHQDGHYIWVETSFRPSEDGTAVSITRDISDRKALELKLENLARLDGLTGLANRRTFDAAINEEVARSQRSGRPLALLMIDADQFKRFNDDYGHLAGDACLKSIASVVAMAARRPGDLAARYGGEEMALLLPNTSLEGASLIAASLCQQIAGLSIPHERNLPWKIATISIGVAAVDHSAANRDYSSEWLISAADMALYDAKARGRNQAIVAPLESDDTARLVS